MLHVTSPTKDVYLVNELPVPVGRTLAGGVAVYDRRFFWECERCRPTVATTRKNCGHVQAVLGYILDRWQEYETTSEN